MIEGGYVGYDARSGDLITYNGENWRVVHTFPAYVGLKKCDDMDGGYCRLNIGYEDLRNARAFYAARLLPCRPPEGEIAP